MKLGSQRRTINLATYHMMLQRKKALPLMVSSPPQEGSACIAGISYKV